ncbi:PadR family transcriptional regulator [Streptosporangiaceae bacterium NEAU-GS5]|nr:PadR family transcriptional regulator [Streptosporangiaceae bacterium NEAU-GS5]
MFTALRTAGAEWRHGYDIAKDTGLKSGTLYPILIRLADRGLLEARWEEAPPTGRPARHLYRLTAEGVAAADAAIAASPTSTRPSTLQSLGQSIRPAAQASSRFTRVTPEGGR